MPALVRATRAERGSARRRGPLPQLPVGGDHHDLVASCSGGPDLLDDRVDQDGRRGGAVLPCPGKQRGALRGPEAHREALRELSGAAVTDSEASVLHAVLVAGLRVVREQAEEAGYAQLAAERNAEQRRAFARRQRPSWADE
jgi:hypothetical protein